MAAHELCVIFNPAAGKHRARRRLDRLRAGWGERVDFWPTERSGHAADLARQAALAGYRVVAAAGGDGTAHEVLNGLMAAARPEVRFSIIPIGSANDYAHSLGLDRDDGQAPQQRAVDVGRVRSPDGREQFFGCNFGLGLNGAVTWESRHVRRLQGMALYGLATLRALRYHFRTPRMIFRIDEEPPWQSPTLLFSILLGRREGGFVLAPRAEVDDGWFDYIHAANLSRWEVLQFLPWIALFGPPEKYPKVRQGRCRRVVLQSEAPLIVHTDGEFFCLPSHDVRELHIDLLPGALTVDAGLLGDGTVKTPSPPASSPP
jgi:diacylglycerol kinase family enzyme